MLLTEAGEGWYFVLSKKYQKSFFGSHSDPFERKAEVLPPPSLPAAIESHKKEGLAIANPSFLFFRAAFRRYRCSRRWTRTAPAAVYLVRPFVANYDFSVFVPTNGVGRNIFNILNL